MELMVSADLKKGQSGLTLKRYAFQSFIQPKSIVFG